MIKQFRVGELRPSQLLYTFGVGAHIDLANLAVLVMGLDFWKREGAVDIPEARLLQAVQRQLGPQVERLYTPPSIPSDTIQSPFDAAARVGVPVSVFPCWLRCPACDLIAPIDSGLFELKDPHRPDRVRYVHVNCGKSRPGRPPTAVPVRFVVACENGHLDDFPWLLFVHSGKTNCNGPLRLYQLGISDGVSDVIVHCDGCNANRPMSEAFGLDAKKILPLCRGYHPHLQRENDCRTRDEHNQTIPTTLSTMLLGATNSWFSITLSVLSVPDASASRLTQRVEDHWPLLANVVSREVLEAFRRIGQLDTFADISDDALWNTIEAKRNATAEDETAIEDLKLPEWQSFSHPDPSQNNEDFQLTPIAVPPGYEQYFSRVVLAERLREVRALVGFTRISSPGEFGEEFDIPPERRAPLSHEPPRWVPAIEARGEGIFIEFNEQTLAAWCQLPKNLEREHAFFESHCQWRRMRQLMPDSDGFPGMRYLLLHSFAHALMRQLTIECGYSAASIRERIYARGPEAAGGPMSGVLIYTAAADSEGTLGGLVAQGHPQRLARHLCQALEDMELCSSDPLCAEHHPQHENATLHGAACHACLFVPETSCEHGNKYLDRTLLTPTLCVDCVPFFPEREASTGERGTEPSVSMEFALPDFLAETSDGVPVYQLDMFSQAWDTIPAPDYRIALDASPEQGFVTRLDTSTLEAQPVKGVGMPLTAGTWVLLERTEAGDFDRQTPQLLVRRNGDFAATGRPWTIGYPSLRETAGANRQLHVRYVSARPECRPENSAAVDVVSIGRLAMVYHAGAWRRI